MAERVINDPSALGWEYDPDTGRWTWGGHSSSGDGGGGEPFPEAPVDGQQYARQDAGWAVIVHPEGGAGGDVDLTGYATETWVSENYQVKGTYLTSETDPVFQASVAAGITEADINKWNNNSGGGGGGDVDLTGYATETWVSANYQVKGNYLTSSSLNGYATETWVGQNYQPKGNYLTGFTESDPTVPAHVKSISQADINKWNSAGSSATPNLQQVTDQGASTSKSITAPNFHCQNDGYTLGGTPNGGARVIILNGFTYSNTSNVGVMVCDNSGNLTMNGDVTAFSDVRLKEDIKTLDGSKVYDMRGVSFTKDGREGSGVIAQELLEVAPELVHDEGEYLSVAYGNLVGYLIEAVKDLRAEVEELKRGDR